MSRVSGANVISPSESPSIIRRNTHGHFLPGGSFSPNIWSLGAEPAIRDGKEVAVNGEAGNERKGFSGKKWLRKLSIGKKDKCKPSEHEHLKNNPSREMVVEKGNNQTTDMENRGVEFPSTMKSIQESAHIEPSEQTPTRVEQHSINKDKRLSEQGVDALTKRDRVVNELVSTERDYVRDLGEIVNGYIRLMRDPHCDIPVPEDLKNGKEKIVFGNIEAIFEWHRDRFLNKLEQCLNHPEKLSPLFHTSEQKLRMYVVYCKNKPMSEHIVSEHIKGYFEQLRQKLGHQLFLGDLLIKPVQRIMKYQLLLREVARYTEKAGLKDEREDLNVALHIMLEIPKAANDMMTVGRLQNFDGKIMSQGRLLRHGNLSCIDDMACQFTRGRKDYQVFLFEQSIIFSEQTGKKTQLTDPYYNYKAHIPVYKMKFDVDGESEMFTVRSLNEGSKRTVFICYAGSPETHREWVDAIHNLLDKQTDFLDALESPINAEATLRRGGTKVAYSLP